MRDTEVELSEVPDETPVGDEETEVAVPVVAVGGRPNVG